jgi:hypothetical protein
MTSNLQPISYISNAAVPSFFMSPITETQVLNLFLGLDSNKVSIDIPNNMIKIAAYELSPIFTNIFNESISTGVVPDILKISIKSIKVVTQMSHTIIDQYLYYLFFQKS